MCSLCARERPLLPATSPVPDAASVTSSDRRGVLAVVEQDSVSCSFEGGELDDIEMCLTCGFVSCSCHMQQHCKASTSTTAELCHCVSIRFSTYSLHCFSCAFSPTNSCPSAAVAKKHIAALRMAAKTRDKLVMTPGRLVRAVTSGLIGLKNGGNTCFANSVVQVMHHVSCLSFHFSHLPLLQSLANIPLFPSTLLRQQVCLLHATQTHQHPHIVLTFPPAL